MRCARACFFRREVSYRRVKSVHAVAMSRSRDFLDDNAISNFLGDSGDEAYSDEDDNCHISDPDSSSSSSYSIDEQMIPFTGRCNAKVYVRNKPRPVGLKNLVVTSAGLMMDFEVYQGSNTDLPDLEKFGLGPAIVLRLAATLPEGSFLYFDRYFTTIPLMTELINRKKEGTGTIQMNRFNTKEEVKYAFKSDGKIKRGDCEEICSSDNKLCLVKWKDNKGVLMISTAINK